MSRAVTPSTAAFALTIAALVTPAFAAPGASPGPEPAPASRTAPTLSQSFAPGLRPEVLRLALEAQECAVARGLVTKPDLLTVIDYSLPSTRRRLWVLDLAHHKVLFHELVAHGRGSGENRATRFSNTPMSLESSLGLMITGETYYGKNGYSLRLDGQTPGVNDQARDRAIVMHGADYVSRGFIHRVGRLGRSWGCPALPRGVARPVIDTIKGGSVLFGYYPDRGWIETSPFLSCRSAGEGIASVGAAAGTP